MPTHQRYPKRLNVYVTAEMQRKLEQVRDQRGPQTTTPDVVREALRLFLDDQEQVIGSRRHFQKTLREEIGTVRSAFQGDLKLVQADLIWANVFSLVLLASSLAPVVARVTGQPVSLESLLKQGVVQTPQHWKQVMQWIEETRATVNRTNVRPK